MKKLVLFISLAASTSSAIGLKEAIRSAIQNNPRTAAIDLRVQAMQDRKKAQYLDLLPSLRVSSSAYYSTTQIESVPGTSQSSGRSNSIGMSVNLYNGGADRASLLAAEERLKALDAEYNSSNSQIPNTRGSFASSVFESYLSLVENYEQRNFVQDLNQKLTFLKNAKLNDEEIKTLNQRINDLQTSLVNVDFGISESQKDFTYFTTLAAPRVEELESLDQLRQGLNIPDNAQAAYQLALEKSPNIQSMNHRLAAETYEQDADRRRLLRPRVDLNTSYSGSNSRSNGGDPFASKGAYVGVTLSYSIDAGSVYRYRAGDKSLEATRRDQEATLADVEYSLNSRYQSLANLERVQTLQEQSLRRADARIADIFRKIQAGEKVEFTDMTSAIDARSGYWQSNLRSKSQLIAARFNLQRTIGTLFEAVSLQRSDYSSIQ